MLICSIELRHCVSNITLSFVIDLKNKMTHYKEWYQIFISIICIQRVQCAQFLDIYFKRMGRDNLMPDINIHKRKSKNFLSKVLSIIYLCKILSVPMALN